MITYQIVTLEQTTPPSPDGSPWFRYVIANDVTAIEGKRSGTREEVHDYLCQYAERLNARQRGPHRW